MLELDRGRLPEVVARHRFEEVPSAARGPRQVVRSAKPGGWHENLSSAERAAMEDALGEALSEFGYGEDLAESAGGRRLLGGLPALAGGLDQAEDGLPLRGDRACRDALLGQRALGLGDSRRVAGPFGHPPQQS